MTPGQLEPPKTRQRPSPLRRWRRVLTLVVVVAALACAADYGVWVVFRHRLIAIDDGSVFQSAEIPPEQLVEVSKARGIKAVIDLRDTRPDAIEAERKALQAAGIEHLHVPSLQDPTPETIATVLDLMGDPRHQPLLVHCEHGEGRSVLMAALYRIEKKGFSNEDAWRASARLPAELQFLAGWFPGLAAFDRDSPKGRILFDFKPLSAQGH
ncbi:MAG: hypothetical protein U1F36_19615 [Planctomycetota bacterium]